MGCSASDSQYTHYVANPMVIFIGIACYEDDAQDPDIGDVYCQDIPLEKDYENIKNLCGILNYDLYPKELKFEWKQKEIISYIEDCAKTVSENMDTLANKSKKKKVNGYDGVIVICSGHGFQDCIVTSDIKLITKTAIHRLVSTHYENIRYLPRICLFDVSDMKLNYKDIQPKRMFDYKDIDQIDDEKETVWLRDQLNPDYKLTIVHAPETAKVNAELGSYLIYQFVIGMIENIQKNRNLHLEDILDQIKDKGSCQYNNRSNFLKFVTNKYDNGQK